MDAEVFEMIERLGRGYVRGESLGDVARRRLDINRLEHREDGRAILRLARESAAVDSVPSSEVDRFIETIKSMSVDEIVHMDAPALLLKKEVVAHVLRRGCAEREDGQARERESTGLQ